MKQIAPFFVLFFTVFLTYPQDPQINWQNTIGGDQNDFARSIEATPDGGFIVGGVSISDISGDKTENSIGDFDYWILKLDASGTIEWQNTIGGDEEENLLSVIPTLDGGYMAAGSSASGISGDKTEGLIGITDIWVVKLDDTGTIEWQNTIGGTNTEDVGEIIQTSDGGYVLGATSGSDISGDKTEDSRGFVDFWIFKIDANGNMLWQKTMGGSELDACVAIVETSDGGFLAAGHSDSDISGDKTEDSNGRTDFWVVKFNSVGQPDWQNTIGGADSEFMGAVIEDQSGAFVIAGDSNSDISGDKTENSQGGFDYWIVTLNPTGLVVYDETIGGSMADFLYDIVQDTDGDYLLGGVSESDASGDKTEDSNGEGDYWVLKIQPTGTIEWQNTIGGAEMDYLWAITLTTAGDVAIVGDSASDISGDKEEDSEGGFDYWVVSLQGILATEYHASSLPLHIYPNPVDDRLQISLEMGFIEAIHVFSSKGDLVTRELDVTSSFQTMDVSQLAAGMYFLQVTSEGKTTTKKFIKR